MTTISPDDIPAEIAALDDTCPYWLPPSGVRVILAHFWPAIEQHIREQVAQEIEQATVTVDGGTYPMQTARTVERSLTVAAAIARGTDTTRSQS